MLKHSLGNTRQLFSLVMSVAPFRRHYYRVDRDTFPLNDSSVLIQPDSVMVALSPRLLLEIDRTQKQPDATISYSNHVAPEKLEEFRRRTIANAFHEIISGTSLCLSNGRCRENLRNATNCWQTQRTTTR